MGDPVSLVKENIQAFSDNDLEKFGEMLTDDAVYVEPGTHRKVESKSAYIELAQGWKQTFPDVAGTITSIFADGDRAVAEISWKGTHDGEMPTPTGGIPATGRTVEVDSCLLATIDGDKIAEVHHYFDFMTMLAQIGAVPEPATA